MTIDKDELRSLASAATPGVWHWEGDVVKNDPYGRTRYQVTTLGKTIAKIYYSSFEGGPTNAEMDARYIAAADPQTVIALLDELGGLRNAVECAITALSDSRDAETLLWVAKLRKYLRDGE